MAAGISGIYTIAISFFLRDKILRTLNEFQLAYESNKSSLLHFYSAQAIFGYFIGVAAIAVGNIVYCWIIDGFGIFNENHFFVPFRFVLGQFEVVFESKCVKN